MIGYISIGSHRIKRDDWQSYSLRFFKVVVSTVPLHKFRHITSIHHIMGSVANVPYLPGNISASGTEKTFYLQNN